MVPRKYALVRFALRKDVPHLLVIKDAIFLMVPNPFAPDKALLLINTQLIASVDVLIPPPIPAPNMLPAEATKINRMV